MKKQLTIGICGNYGRKNLGDELILEGIIKEIRSQTPTARIVVFSAKPKETTKIHHVEAVEHLPAGFRSFFKKKNSRKALKALDKFILGGGGLFGSLKRKANWIWGLQAFQAIKAGVSLEIKAVSVGENWGFADLKLFKYISKHAKKISTRDQISQKRIEKLTGCKTLLEPDPAFTVMTDFKNKNSSEKSIVICLRKMDYPQTEFLNNIAKAINTVNKGAKHPIKIIDFVQRKNSDPLLHDQLEDLFKKKTKTSAKAKLKSKSVVKVKRIKNIQTSKQLQAAIKDAKIVIGMRLHSIITAKALNKKFVALSYDSKIDQLIEAKHIIKAKDLQPEELVKKLQELLS